MTPMIVRKSPGWVISDDTAAIAVDTYAQAAELYLKVLAMERRGNVREDLRQPGDGPDRVGAGPVGR